MAIFDADNKDKMKKRAIFSFFETITNNFSKLILVNLMYFVCILPMFLGVVYFFCVLFISPESTLIQNSSFIHLTMWALDGIIKVIGPIFAVILFILSCVAYGPMTAGLTYCTRNISQKRVVFVTDIFTKAKENLKQGLFLGIADIFVAASFMLYLASDSSALNGSYALVFKIIKIIAFFVCVLYLVIRFYTYSICVTFELKLSDVFKNSFIFLVLGFLRNVIALIISALIIFTFLSTPRIDMILIATLLFSILRYSIQFTTYPIIEKYMLNSEQ